MKTFDIPSKYKSPIISRIKASRKLKDRMKKNFEPTALDFEKVTVLIARHFGFCYGVENAVEIAYRALKDNPGKRLYLLSEMIHNPGVNDDLKSEGVEFLMDTGGNRLVDFKNLNKDDIVIVPAFGTTVEIQDELSGQGVNPYKFDTTCPFVQKVWNRAGQIGNKGYTVIVHGKPHHEETRATFSHSSEKAYTLVIRDMSEAENLAKYIRKEKTREEFFEEFADRYSEGFDPDLHLVKLGVVNQTTMLATETQAIAEYLRDVLIDYYNLDEKNTTQHFANTKDTLCYATNENQDATYALIEQDADFAIVVGGYNSSNTGHLVELLEEKMPTYFIRASENILSDREILHFDRKRGKEILTTDYLPEGVKPRVILTCGASCPDAVVEEVLRRFLGLFDEEENLENNLEESLAKY